MSKFGNISVIVPVYNAASFLKQSIESLLTQTYKEFELILVDDGSKDDSGKICDDYATMDSRIKVVHQKNAGASEARNTGIVASSCELITFVDADDAISREYLECLIADYLKAVAPDFVIQGMIQKWPDHDTTFQMRNGVYDFSLNQSAQFFEHVKINDFSGPYCKLYRRSILDTHNIRFSQNIIYGEDFDFMLRYLMRCKVVVTSSATNYYYIMHEGSVSSKIYDFDKELSGLQQLYDSFDEIIKRYPNAALAYYRNQSINAYIWRVLHSIYKHRYTKNERIIHLKRINTKFRHFFHQNYSPTTLFTKLVKALLVAHYYRTLDFILFIRL